MFDFAGFLGWFGQYLLVWLAMLACIIIGYIGGHSFGWTDGYGQAVRDNLAADHFIRAAIARGIAESTEEGAITKPLDKTNYEGT